MLEVFDIDHLSGKWVVLHPGARECLEALFTDANLLLLR